MVWVNGDLPVPASQVQRCEILLSACVLCRLCLTVFQTTPSFPGSRTPRNVSYMVSSEYTAVPSRKRKLSTTPKAKTPAKGKEPAKKESEKKQKKRKSTRGR